MSSKHTHHSFMKEDFLEEHSHVILTSCVDVVGFQYELSQSGEISEQIKQRAASVVPVQFSVLSQCEESQIINVHESFLVDSQEVVVVLYGDAVDGVVSKHLVRDGLESSFIEDQV